MSFVCRETDETLDIARDADELIAPMFQAKNVTVPQGIAALMVVLGARAASVTKAESSGEEAYEACRGVFVEAFNAQRLLMASREKEGQAAEKEDSARSS